jgi:hypothetical protein
MSEISTNEIEEYIKKHKYIQYVIRKMSIEGQSKENAYNYVLCTNGDLKKILEEINRTESRINEGNNSGPMAPGATPRIYQDNYLCNLRDAYKIIKIMTEYGEEWSNNDK